MKAIGLVSLCLFLSAPGAYAAPEVYKANCTIPKTVVGELSPGKSIQLKKGDREVIYQEGDLNYEVYYGDFLEQQPNLLQLRIYDRKTNLQSLSNMNITNEFPWMIQHVSEKGNFFCELVP